MFRKWFGWLTSPRIMGNMQPGDDQEKSNMSSPEEDQTQEKLPIPSDQSNQKDYQEPDDDQNQRRSTQDGRTLPKPPSYKASALPKGWEIDRDEDGKTFFIDHNTKNITWNDPRDQTSTSRRNPKSSGHSDAAKAHNEDISSSDSQIQSHSEPQQWLDDEPQVSVDLSDQNLATPEEPRQNPYYRPPPNEGWEEPNIEEKTLWECSLNEVRTRMDEITVPGLLPFISEFVDQLRFSIQHHDLLRHQIREASSGSNDRSQASRVNEMHDLFVKIQDRTRCLELLVVAFDRYSGEDTLRVLGFDLDWRTKPDHHFKHKANSSRFHDDDDEIVDENDDAYSIEDTTDFAEEQDDEDLYSGETVSTRERSSNEADADAGSTMDETINDVAKLAINDTADVDKDEHDDRKHEVSGTDASITKASNNTAVNDTEAGDIEKQTVQSDQRPELSIAEAEQIQEVVRELPTSIASNAPLSASHTRQASRNRSTKVEIPPSEQVEGYKASKAQVENTVKKAKQHKKDRESKRQESKRNTDNESHVEAEKEEVVKEEKKNNKKGELEEGDCEQEGTESSAKGKE